MIECKEKSYKDIQIGDIAYYCSDLCVAGIILDKGTFRELYKIGYESVVEMEEFYDELPFDDECVAISQDPGSTLEGFETFIFMYNMDPSSVVCLNLKYKP